MHTHMHVHALSLLWLCLLWQVHWSPIEYQDNQGCIDLIEKNPHGILRILDTQCKVPGGSDATFCEAVNSAHKASDFTTSVQRAKRRTDEALS